MTWFLIALGVVILYISGSNKFLRRDVEMLEEECDRAWDRVRELNTKVANLKNKLKVATKPKTKEELTASINWLLENYVD